MKPSRRADPAPASSTDPCQWAVLAKTHGSGSVLPTHAHSRGQLLCADQGVMLVDAQATRWVVPPQRALWLPAGVPHSVRVLSTTRMRTVYFRPPLVARAAQGERLAAIQVVDAVALLRELITGLFEPGFDRATQDTMALLLLQTLRRAPALPTAVPLPVSPTLCRAVEPLLQANQWHLPMAALADRVALSERSFTRRFRAELGLSFRAWRQRARLLASLDLLGAGCSVKAVAHDLQFAGEAAYVAAFRELFGSPPGAFR